MQENCISHVQRTDNILMRSTKDWWPPLSPFLKNIPPPSPFWKIFGGILLIYVACPGLFNKRRVVYLQRSARRSGMPDPWNWSPSKCTTQHPRRSHFWCTKSQVWSGWKTIAEIQKGLRLNNALLIKTRTMQRTTVKFVSWFFPTILLRTIFEKFILSLIYWGEASYDQSITTAGLLKHKNIKYIHVIFNNINTIMHTGLQSFLIYHLMFVRTMYGACLSS